MLLIVWSCLDYCNALFIGAGERHLDQLQLIQNAATKAITGKYKYEHLGNDLQNLHWLTIRKRIVFKIALLAYKAIMGTAPTYIQDMFRYTHYGYSIKLTTAFAQTQYGQRSFSYIAPRIFNRLPSSITSKHDLKDFKCSLKTYLFNLPVTDLEKLYRQ